MQDSNLAASSRAGIGGAYEVSASAVSWAAIIAGAAVAAAASLLLFALGSGLGFASASPWPAAGASVKTFAMMTAIWLIVMQWVSAGVGGYITGRLRTKWVNIHTHEVFFRDTAHGFLAWAVATLLVSLVLASSASSVVGGAVQATATVAGGAAQGAANGAAANGLPTRAYDVDTLFRSTRPDTSAAAGQARPADPRAEATRILAVGMANGDVNPADRAYLAQLVAANTGISQDEAQKRVDDAITQEKAAEAKAREAADTARKAASAFSLFTALSMLIGAFIASAAAAFGGKLRDEHL